LIVRSYDEVKKTSVVRDFMSILGLTGDEFGIDLDNRANSQAPLAEAFELYFQGHFGRAPDWGEKKIIEAIFEALGDRTIDISWPSQKKIIRKFLRSNEHVYEKYGIPEFRRMKASRLTSDAPANWVNLEDLFSHQLLRFIYDIARTLSGDRQKIVDERDAAVHDRNMIAIAWNQALSENGQLVDERNALIQERNLLAQERDGALRAPPKNVTTLVDNLKTQKSLGMLSRKALMRGRDRLLKASKGGKYLLGGLLLLVGLLIISGLDKKLETALVEASPAWLTDLTTRF